MGSWFEGLGFKLNVEAWVHNSGIMIEGLGSELVQAQDLGFKVKGSGLAT